MDLLERYLQAIRKYLPWNLPRARQEDILAELRANYESQLEEREADLGRPLTEGEMIDWLKQLGSPIHAAARYQPTQYLIGPAIFPMYLYVLRLSMFLALIVGIVVNLVVAWTSTPNAASIVEVFLRVPGALFLTAAWVTLIFAVIEYILANHPHLLPQMDGISTEWTPSRLPPLEHPRRIGRKQPQFARSAAEVIFGWLLLGWLLLVPKYPFLMFGPGWTVYFQHTPFQLAPVWWTFYWAAVAFQFSQALWNTMDLVSGQWRAPSPIKPLFFKAGGLITIGILLSAAGHVYAMVRDSATDAEKYHAALNQINPSLYHAMQLVFVIAAAQFAWEVIKLVRDRAK